MHLITYAHPAVTSALLHQRLVTATERRKEHSKISLVYPVCLHPDVPSPPPTAGPVTSARPTHPCTNAFLLSPTKCLSARQSAPRGKEVRGEGLSIACPTLPTTNRKRSLWPSGSDVRLVSLSDFPPLSLPLSMMNTVDVSKDL